MPWESSRAHHKAVDPVRRPKAAHAARDEHGKRHGLAVRPHRRGDVHLVPWTDDVHGEVGGEEGVV